MDVVPCVSILCPCPMMLLVLQEEAEDNLKDNWDDDDDDDDDKDSVEKEETKDTQTSMSVCLSVCLSVCSWVDGCILHNCIIILKLCQVTEAFRRME